MDPIRFRWRTSRACCHNCARSMPCSRKTLILTACAALVCVAASSPKKDEGGKKPKADSVKKQDEKKGGKKSDKGAVATQGQKQKGPKPGDKPPQRGKERPATPPPNLRCPF